MELACVLREALACLAKLRGQALVLKIGGEVIISPQFKQVVSDIALLHLAGLPITLIFGAGQQIDAEMRKAGLEIIKKDGLRVTPLKAIPIIKDVCDSIFLEISRVFAEVGVKCNFLPPNRIIASPLSSPDNNYGSTGRADKMSVEGVKQTEDLKAITVASSLASYKETYLNVNADEVAYIVAKETKTEKLIFLTGVDGVQVKDGNTIFQITAADAALLIKNGTVSGGMIPKLEFAVKAFADGVRSCHIVNYKRGHLLEEILTTTRAGTIIVP